MKSRIGERVSGFKERVGDVLMGGGQSAPIVPHYPKDRQRHDAKQSQYPMDGGWHMPGITDGSEARQQEKEE
ncbi:MAG TPA: hypothetical protein VLB73_04605 [Patescibacteria group bacterium]|nr:hypothetical protein [Patescibacteria group bacterium]